MEEERSRPLVALVVWEPVIVTDLGPPTSGTLALLPDPRVRQFWDAELTLSRAIVQAALADPEEARRDGVDQDTVVWDFVALFPPGTRWEGAFPSAAWHGYPVVQEIDGLRRRLRQEGGGEAP